MSTSKKNSEPIVDETLYQQAPEQGGSPGHNTDRCRLVCLFATIFGLKFLRPQLRVPAMMLLGLVAGLALLLVQTSRATSYLYDSPETCMNCHVMTDAYVSWHHSSHGRHTTCNDCHVPHTSFVREYAFKASDGLRHAAIFMFRAEPQTIKLSTGAIPVTQENCIRCHETINSEVATCRHRDDDFRCWDCHREVPHGRVHSLSASPDTTRPRLPSVLKLIKD